MSPQHHLLIEHIIVHSHRRGWALECCKKFGISRAWLSIVMNSDVFRERFERRLAEHQRITSIELAQQVTHVAGKALERLSHVLDDPECDDRLALDIANSTLKQLGFGARPGSGPVLEREVTRTSTRTVAPGVLETARETYRTQTHGEAALPAPKTA